MEEEHDEVEEGAIKPNNIRAKKYLGQHFLTSTKIVDDILDVSKVTKDDIVLEIGPGKGVLTSGLLERAKQVIALEKDKELLPFLGQRFSEEIHNNQLVLIEEDALTFDTEKYIEEPYKLIANIPYYITGALLRTYLESPHPPECITFLLQKEVAQRIVARDGKESILSMSVRAYGEPKYVEKVPARYFKPAPNVDSAIMYIKNISKKNFVDVREEEFFDVLRTGFAHKRKMLINNLEEIAPKAVISGKFKTCGVPLDARAETLTLKQWLCLAKREN